MKSRASWLIVLAFLAGLCVGGWTATGRQRPQRGQWEHYALYLDLSSQDEFAALNKVGVEGWELVGVMQLSGAHRAYYFKRAK